MSIEHERCVAAASVRSAGDARDLARAREVHAKVSSSRYATSRFFGNLLIEMYGKCGSLEDAEAVFARIREPNLFTNNIMIACYARNGEVQRAEELFDRMSRKDSFSWTAMINTYGQASRTDLAKRLFDYIPDPSPASWNALIAAHAQRGDLDRAMDLFDTMPCKDIISWNTIISMLANNGKLLQARNWFDRMPLKNTVTWNTLITAYAWCGDLFHARALFDQMPQPDSTSWNVLLDAYCKHGMLIQATQFLKLMPSPTAVSYSTIISAYSQHGDLDRARSILDSIPRSNDSLAAWNAMLAGYAARGHLRESLAIFHQIPAKDATTWSNLVLSYINAGDHAGALATFHQMPHKTPFHCTIILTAFAQRGNIPAAECVFHQIRPSPDTAARNAMLSAYSLNGQIQDARRIFDDMPERDIISWTSMISAYAGRSEALVLFARMDLDGISIDRIAFVAAADACSDLEHGKMIHDEARAMELDRDLQIGTAVMTMYSRSGSLQNASLIFESLPERDAQCWNSMIAAYAQLGHTAEAVRLAHLMILDGVKMDGVTLLCLLSSCSHGGFFRTGCEFFRFAAVDFSIPRTADHYGCMVDLLGRAGWIHQAQELMNSMPFEPDVATWTSLITAGVTHHGSKASRNAS